MKSRNCAKGVWLLILGLGLTGCSTHAEPSAEAPPAAHVEHEQDLDVVTVERPEQFSLVAAGQWMARSELAVTGTVGPDVSRTVPVISLAAGRVVEIHAR